MKNGDEKAGREKLAEMLLEGESLASCLGGMITIMRLCGTDADRRMAKAADAAILGTLN